MKNPPEKKPARQEDRFTCKFCRKRKRSDAQGMNHEGKPVCRECMEKGW